MASQSQQRANAGSGSKNAKLDRISQQGKGKTGQNGLAPEVGGRGIGALKENGTVVHALSDAIYRGERSIDSVPGLIKRVIREGCWRRRIIAKTGELVEFDRFEDFINTPPLEGLGASLRTVQNLCRDDAEALSLVDETTAGNHGGDRKSDEIKNNNVTLDTNSHADTMLLSCQE